MKISPLKEENIQDVVEIEDVSFSVPKKDSIFRHDQNKYLVAEENGKIIGYIGTEEISGETHIINMAVAPGERGKGYGKRLIEAVLDDENVFFLEVRASNNAARKLYEKYGFEKVGVRKNYYEDNGEDACIMRREPRE
ncbi:MAG: ribosomal protein S18-alanine N-acetyltransferase [Candidatus Margulisiibacteriota bacterium]